MPGQAVLLPLCVGLSLLGVIAIVVAGRRGNKGRIVQGVAVALLPVALYLSGLLDLVWRAAVALGSYVTTLVLSPLVWAGLGLLLLCLVLWVVGGVVARRSPGRRRRRKEVAEATPGALPDRRRQAPATTTGTTAGTTPATRRAPAEDDEMAEIEAMLKARGIE